MISLRFQRRTHPCLGEVGNILMHVFFHTNCSTLDKLPELCPFMQIVLPHENQVEDFFLTHAQSSEIINFDIVFSLSE